MRKCNPKSRIIRFILINFLLSCTAAFASNSLSYSGRLVNANGSPVNGNVNLKAELAYTNSLTTIRCIDVVSNVPLSNGVFHTKLDFDCDPSTLSTVLALIPTNESVAIRITDITDLSNPKAYSFQSLYSVPSSIISRMALQIAQMSATDGQVLTWDGSANKWVPQSPGGNGTVTSISTGIGLAGGVIENSGTISIATQGVETILIKDGAVTSVKIEDGTIVDADISATAQIEQSKIKDLTTALAAKESLISSGSSTDYLDGNKAWQDFNQAVRSTFLLGYAVVPTPTSVAATDTVLEAIGKLEGQIIANDTAFDNSGQWSKDGSLIYYNTGNVGIGTSTPGEKLHVAGNLAVDGKLRLKDSGANFVELKSPTTLSGIVTFTLPSALGTNGQVLITDASGNMSWSTLSTDSSAIVDGSIVDDDISASANIAQSKIAGLGTALAGKEPILNLGTTADYYRGDKTWVTLDTGAVPEGTRLYFTELRVRDTDLAGLATIAGSVTAADSVLTSIGKLAGNQANYVLKAGDTMSGNLLMGGNTVTGLGAPLLDSDAVTKLYVDARWMKTGTSLYYTDGNIGVGTSTPNEKLTVDGVASFKEGVAPTATANYGKLYVKTSDSKLYFMDDAGVEIKLGSTDGGTPGANTVSTSEIVDGTIIDADISASANIAQSKILNLTTDLAAKQASDSDLTALAGLTGTGVLVRTGDGTAITRTIEGTANRLSVTDGNGVAGNPVLDISTSLLPSPLVGDAGKFLKASGANTSAWQALASGDITTALGFTPINKSGDSITSGVFDFNTSSVVRVLDPIGITDVANKQYVDSQVAGASNQWAQSSGNVYRTSGNVGIGTTTPAYKLDVQGNVKALEVLDIASASTDGYGAIRFKHQDGARIMLDYGTGTSEDFRLLTGTGLSGSEAWTERFRLSANGNVGIGTTNPLGTLHTSGTLPVFHNRYGVVASHLVLRSARGSSSSPTAVQTGEIIGTFSAEGYDGSGYSESAHMRILATENQTPTTKGSEFTFWTVPNGSPSSSLVRRMTIGNDGNIGIGTSTPATRLHIDGTSEMLRLTSSGFGTIYAGSDTNQPWLGTSSNHDFRLVTNSVEKIRITATGNVGIGTANPGAKLDVSGSAGNFQITDDGAHMNFTRGSLNYIKATSASGSFRFVVNGNTDAGAALEIASNGNVGIGTTTPSKKLEVAGSQKVTGNIAAGGYDPDSWTGGYGSAGIQTWDLAAHGAVYSQNGYQAFSDRRLKKDIEPIKNALNKVLNLRGVYYNWKQPDQYYNKRQIGVIAQEVYDVIPEVISRGDGPEDYMSVDYSKLTSVLIEGMKEQQAQIEKNKQLYLIMQGTIKAHKVQLNSNERTIASLKDENQQLKVQNGRLENRLEALENKFIQLQKAICGPNTRMCE